MKAFSTAVLLTALVSAPAMAHDIQVFSLNAEQGDLEIDGIGASGRFYLGENDNWVIHATYADAEEKNTGLGSEAYSAGFEYISKTGTLNGVFGIEASRAESKSTSDSSDSTTVYLGGQGKAFYVHLGLSIDSDNTEVLYRAGARFGSEKKLGGLGLFFEVSGNDRAEEGQGSTTGSLIGINYHF